MGANSFSMSTSTLTPTVLTLTDKTKFSLTYAVRDDITVTIEQRHLHKGGGYDEARAVFSHSAQSFHDVVLMIGDLLQIAQICGHPQPEEVVNYFDSNAEFEPQKHGGGDFAPEDTWKEYKLRDSGWKTNLWVHNNTKLELEHKYGGKGEPWNKITLQLADILAVLPLFKYEAIDKPAHTYQLQDQVWYKADNCPFTVVGIRVDEVEIRGDFSGGTHAVVQTGWVPVSQVESWQAAFLGASRKLHDPVPASQPVA